MVVISLTYLNCNNQYFYSFLIQKLIFKFYYISVWFRKYIYREEVTNFK
jgi:hypothetical protein